MEAVRQNQPSRKLSALLLLLVLMVLYDALPLLSQHSLSTKFSDVILSLLVIALILAAYLYFVG